MNKELSEEKRNEYQERRKETVRMKRASWHQAVVTDDYSGRNLEFLIYIYRSLGLKRKQFAQMLGRTQPTLDYWLITDDIHLSTLQDAFLHMGLRLECKYIINDDSPLRRPFKLDIDEPLVTIHESDAGRFGYSISMPKMVLQPQHTKFGGTAGNVSEDARLFFLAEVMRECGLRLRPFSNATKIGYMKLFKNLMNDDILISTINEIAANSGMSVKWNLVPIKDKK